MPFITQGKTNWKLLLIIIILAIIVGGGALWYVKRPEQPYQPPEIKKSETASWKTYKNEEYGYEIKYPKDWELTGSEGKTNISYPYKVMGIEVRDITLADFIKEYEKPDMGEKIIKQEDYVLDNIEGVKLTATTGLGIDRNYIFIIKNNKSYIIDFYDFEPLHLNIISTFKFLEEIKTADFTPLKLPSSPSFIKSLNNSKDVKIDPHYEGDYPGFSWPEPEFYTPAGSSEKFLSLSKLKERSGEYAYGPDYNSIFNPEGSHSYGGTPIYLLNKDSKYSVSFIGLKINNRDLTSELKIEFGIDYMGEQIGKSKSSIIASIFSIDTAYACGPGLYLRPVGDSNLIFVEESNGIAWYRLEKPVAIYNLSLSYCDQDCSSKPSYCNNMADDPVECEDFWCCFYNSSISSLENGNLRMHILYKPNDKEGFLKLQMANLILSDPAGTYYQPIMGEYFDHYYRAYLH